MPGDLFPDQLRGPHEPGFVPLAVVRDAAERRQIERALEETGGQIAKAAGLLAISRTTLWEKMTRFGIAEKARSILNQVGGVRSRTSSRETRWCAPFCNRINGWLIGRPCPHR
jgi:hypothetical protein